MLSRNQSRLNREALKHECSWVHGFLINRVRTQRHRAVVLQWSRYVLAFIPHEFSHKISGHCSFPVFRVPKVFGVDVPGLKGLSRLNSCSGTGRAAI